MKIDCMSLDKIYGPKASCGFTSRRLRVSNQSSMVAPRKRFEKRDITDPVIASEACGCYKEEMNTITNTSKALNDC